jgi:excisionase family DNA binding protein
LPTKIPSPHQAGGPDRRRGDATPSGSLPAPSPTLPATALLDAKTVAARLDVSLRTVRRWIAAGELPVHRLDRSVRVSEDDLARFLAARRQP